LSVVEGIAPGVCALRHPGAEWVGGMMGKVLKRAACAGLVLATVIGLFVGGALWGFREALATPRQLLTAGAGPGNFRA